MSAVSSVSPVIVVGAGRSGTNLVRDILCSFTGHATWPCDEINYIWRHGNRSAPTDELTADDARAPVVRYVRAAFEHQRSRAGGGVVVEKTCATSLRVAFAHRIFPEARFVVVVRDGRDVTASAMRRWTARLDLPYVLRKARFVPPADLPYYAARYARARWRRLADPQQRLATWGPRYDGLDEAARTRPLAEVCAQQWARCVEATDRQLAYVDPASVHRLRYEDLVTQPDVEAGRLADFLGLLPPHGELPAIRPDTVGRWRERLGRDEVAGVDAVAGRTLVAQGYA
jgi:hypothetical protein